jgi:hypothetical protein
MRREGVVRGSEVRDAAGEYGSGENVPEKCIYGRAPGSITFTCHPYK